VGSLFGELARISIRRLAEQMRAPDAGLRIVEAGAHDGKLARNVLAWLRDHRRELSQRVEYCIVEPSEMRQGLAT